MKSYIGTKQVTAEPMTLGVFINTRKRDPYANDEFVHATDEPGYLVRYDDGYESWSPKDVFEKAYRCADTPLDRMKIERDELAERRRKLLAFMETDKFKSLDKGVRYMMHIQCGAMLSYQEALEDRMVLMQKGDAAWIR